MKYDKDKIISIFDNLPGCKIDDNPDDIVVRVCTDAFEMLDLKKEDVLLDMGSGTGEYSFKAAPLCKKVIGIDISPRRVGLSKKVAADRGLHNVEFYNMAFEDAGKSDIIKSSGINKVLFNYSLHHLPDPLKVECLKLLSDILVRPSRIVIGDIIFFENPENYKEDFDKIDYDGGMTDLPSTIDFLYDAAKQISKHIEVKQYHPLAGVIRIF